MSYPRTGSRYISEDVFDEMPERVALLGQYHRFAGYAAGLDGTLLNRRSVNDGKVTDHHDLVITENLPGKLTKDERTVYELVAGRMLEAFSGKCVKEVITAVLSVAETDFTVKGAVMKKLDGGLCSANRNRARTEKPPACHSFRREKSSPL